MEAESKTARTVISPTIEPIGRSAGDYFALFIDIRARSIDYSTGRGTHLTRGAPEEGPNRNRDHNSRSRYGTYDSFMKLNGQLMLKLWQFIMQHETESMSADERDEIRGKVDLSTPAPTRGHFEPEQFKAVMAAADKI